MEPTISPSPFASPCTVNGEPVPCDQFFDWFAPFFLGAGIFLFLFLFIMMAIAMIGFVFQILMIIHAVQNDIKDRPLWIIVMVLTGALGAIIYYFVVKQPFDEAQKMPARPAKRPRRKKR